MRLWFFITWMMLVWLGEAEARAPRAVWLWSLDNMDVVTLVRDLQTKRVQTVYLDPGQFLYDVKARARVQRVVRALNQSHIRTEFLLGNPQWIYSSNQENAFRRARLYLARIQELPESDRPRGFHYDIEPQSLPEWNTGRTSLVEDYVALIQSLTRMVHEAHLEMSIDAGFYFDSISVESLKRPLSEVLLDMVDYYVIMAYRDRVDGENGILALCREEMHYEQAHQMHKVVIGIETGPNQEGAFLTFLDDGLAALNGALEKLEEAPVAGIAIHHYETWMALR